MISNIRLKSYSSVEAGTIVLAFLEAAAAFSSGSNFLFAIGAAEPEGLSDATEASLGDDLNGGETFAGEEVCYGLSSRSLWSYKGISSPTLSSEESSNEADTAILDFLATD